MMEEMDNYLLETGFDDEEIGYFHNIVQFRLPLNTPKAVILLDKVMAKAAIILRKSNHTNEEMIVTITNFLIAEAIVLFGSDGVYFDGTDLQWAQDTYDEFCSDGYTFTKVSVN